MKAKQLFTPLAILLFSLLSISSLQAQFGISASYLNGQGDNWQYTPPVGSSETIDLPGTGWQAGVDYWFRLRDTRIEFLPTLAFSSQENTITSQSLSMTGESQAFHFFFNSNIYFMDLSGDCDCPTFSKEGPTLQKGLFLQVSPGYSFYSFNLDGGDTGQNYESDDSAFSIGGGLGFDLGVSDFLTITPLATLRYYPSLSWSDLDVLYPAELEEESSLMQFGLGIRLGVRLDD